MQKAAISLGRISKAVTSVSDPRRLSSFANKMRQRSSMMGALASKSTGPRAMAATRAANKAGVAQEAANFRLGQINPVPKHAPSFELPNPNHIQFGDVPKPSQFPAGSNGGMVNSRATSTMRPTAPIRRVKTAMIELVAMEAFVDEIEKIARAADEARS